jgi:hypothetical protein
LADEVSIGLLVLLSAFLVPAAIICSLARVGGWKTLAEYYPCIETSPSPKKWLGYGVFRKWVGYNGGIVVSSNERGLYLAGMPVILSFCHAPIFIPWSDVREIRAYRRFGATLYRIHTRRAPEVDFALRSGTFDFVRKNAVRAEVRIVEAQ